MIIDPPAGFRGELLAALDPLIQQIEGLEILELWPSFSQSARDLIDIGLSDRTRRRDLILNILAAKDHENALIAALKADGYPATPGVRADRAIFNEIKKEGDAITTAMKIFLTIGSGASAIGLDTDNPVHTSQPVPSS